MSGHHFDLRLSLNDFIATIDAGSHKWQIKRELQKLIRGSTALRFTGCDFTNELFEGMLDWMRTNTPVQLAAVQSLKVFCNRYAVTLSRDIFAGLNSLQLLEFDSWHVHLNPGAIAGLLHLEKLKMTHCGLEQLSVGTIENCPQLRELDFAQNNIHVVDPGFFDSFSCLQRINLKDNSIPRNLPEGVFSNLPELRKLDFGDAKISLDTVKINNLPKLEYLFVNQLMLFNVEFLRALKAPNLKFIGEPGLFGGRCAYHMSNEMTVRDITQTNTKVLKAIYTLPWRGIFCEIFGARRYYFKSALSAFTDHSTITQACQSCFIVAATILGRDDARRYECFRGIFSAAGAGSSTGIASEQSTSLAMLPVELKAKVLEYALPINPLKPLKNELFDVSFETLGIEAHTTKSEAQAMFYEHFAAFTPEKKPGCFFRR